MHLEGNHHCVLGFTHSALLSFYGRKGSSSHFFMSFSSPSALPAVLLCFHFSPGYVAFTFVLLGLFFAQSQIRNSEPLSYKYVEQGIIY